MRYEHAFPVASEIKEGLVSLPWFIGRVGNGREELTLGAGRPREYWMAQGVPGRLCGSRGTPAFRNCPAAAGRRAQFHGFRTRSADLSYMRTLRERILLNDPETIAECRRSIAREGTVFGEERMISTCLEYFVAFPVGRPVQELPATWLRGTGVARGIGPRRRHYRGPRVHRWQKADDAP